MCERDGALRNGGEAMASHRLSAAELKAFANQYHGEIVGVRGMTVRSHLMDANHRFGADQLVGLSEQEMLAVHSGHHNNQIQPSEMVPAAVVASRASAVGGSINARPQIEAAIAFIRQRVGEGVPMRFEWDRTGAQSLPLLKGGAWTPDAIYGKSGEFRISAEGAVGLPLQDVAIGYRFVKGRLRLRGETEIDAGILDWSHAGGDGASTGGGSGAVGIDPMTLLTVFSVLNSIWQALHPTADLTLGGNISCEAILHGDTLAVKFKQAPSVRVVAWFTFVLGVDAVDISTEKVRIGFTGSRWVKERTLEVN